jgi:hypothetical protein
MWVDSRFNEGPNFRRRVRRVEYLRDDHRDHLNVAHRPPFDIAQ